MVVVISHQQETILIDGQMDWSAILSTRARVAARRGTRGPALTDPFVRVVALRPARKVHVGIVVVGPGSWCLRPQTLWKS